jgi:hypothetical protein
MSTSPAGAPTTEIQADLQVETDGPPGHRWLEPVTCGIPWPRGALHDVRRLSLYDEQGNVVPVQARALDRWPDKSARWVLLDWQACVPQLSRYRLRPCRNGETPAVPLDPVRAYGGPDGLTIETGAARFELSSGAFPFARVVAAGERVIDQGATRFTAEDEAGRVYVPEIRALRLEESGPLRAAVRVEGVLGGGQGAPLLDFLGYLHFFAGSATVRFELTLRNPRKAEHPGGFWALGSGGSVYLRDAAVVFTLSGEGNPGLRCSAEPGAALESFPAPLELYQDSSGGENWKSPNHKNRHRDVPNAFRGYRLRADGNERAGLRATPLIALSRGARQIALAMRHFWQNFPKAVTATTDAVTLHLFPRQYADVHEIQGGEQKTHTFHVAFGPDPVTAEPLAWCRSPLLPRATPDWYCASGAIPYLTPRADDPSAVYLQLVDAAIEGGDTFEHKREVVDEYGWRHFGDIYGDHEAVFHPGPAPLVSHYNNQYDPLAGFAYQFLRDGDPRWWHAMRELAAHVTDIDIYHTDRDKAAYNHGLFWHTYHYVDADTATHRTYPRTGHVPGGGPANEQNYTTGLMLNHFLTGDPRSREAAVGLARWVIDMDDGGKTVFHRLARGYTGLASSSRTPLYHGPGRGAANSVAALLDGHRLTGDAAFLAKAEQLVRRVIHPADDVEGRNLLDAENRWFYIMFLQSLGRYLDYKAELGQLDRAYAYARASLLHYARWMAGREYPYLEKPEILEYPTETWAAQDMRKSEVFKYAAKHAAGEERARFAERSEFFFRYATTALAGMKTRTLCRPVVLLLSYGFMHAYFQRHPETAAPPPAEAAHDFGTPEVFVPQKVRAKKRLRFLAAIAAGLTALAAVVGVVYWLAS